MRIRRAVAGVGAALVLALSSATPALAAATPEGAAATPDAAALRPCPNVVAPGPPVDESEVPRAGRTAPPPLPVPDEPVGGPAMGACGDVVAEGAPTPPDVGVDSYVVADLDSGTVLAARNPHARLRPASLMKVLTGLLVARGLDMDDTVIGTQEDANQEGTRVGMGPGGRYTVRQVFEAMMMASGNDAAHALAVKLTGSVEGTLARMNETARSIGALDTRAATPSGLDGPGMQSSAYDLASIFRLGMREEPFAVATRTRRMQLPGYGGKPPIPVANDNKLFANYDGAIGGKTGFTDDARHTYIGAAQRDGRRLVVVLMRGEQRPVPMFEQGIELLDSGFARDAGQGVATLTDARPGTPGPGGSSDTANGDPAPTSALDARGGAAASWGTPLVLLGVVVVILLVVGLRLRDRR